MWYKCPLIRVYPDRLLLRVSYPTVGFILVLYYHYEVVNTALYKLKHTCISYLDLFGIKFDGKISYNKNNAFLRLKSVQNIFLIF